MVWERAKYWWLVGVDMQDTGNTQRLITVCAQKAREKIRQTHCAEEDHPDVYFGGCDENAVTLLSILADNLPEGYTASIRVGGMDIDGEPTPETLADAHSIGTLHYWVEVDGPDGERFYCDVCSESDANYGEVAVVTERPGEYLPVGGAYTVSEFEAGDVPDDRILLWWVARKARDAVLDDWGITEEDNGMLWGECYRLGEYLLSELHSVWNDEDYEMKYSTNRVDCYIMVGGLSNSNPELNDVDAPLRGDVEPHDHVWVEATNLGPNDEEVWVIDLFRRTEWAEDKILVNNHRPEEYVPTVNGRVSYAELLGDEPWDKLRA